MKKVTVVGRGTVGCLAVSHFLKWTDWEINWLYDPNISPAPVGEGTTLTLPNTLFENLDFDPYHLDKIHSTPKLGIWKRNWGIGKEFYHTFPAGRVGIHFNALEFQDYIFKMMEKNSRIKFIESNYNDPNEIDSDLIMVCTGSPKNLENDFLEQKYIPLNSAIVFQCPWELPKFLYSITFAKKYGWVFGIPLKNRCAIGYVYNKDFCSVEDIKEDVQPILDEFNLIPSVERSLTFNNYYRKINFTDRVVYNGNASFFLEPLEATSTTSADWVNRLTLDAYLYKVSDLDFSNDYYNNMLDNIGNMISLHYLSGSIYKNDFWDFAKQQAMSKLDNVLKNNNDFSKIIDITLNNDYSLELSKTAGEVGTWSLRSYKLNIENLGLEETLKNMIHK